MAHPSLASRGRQRGLAYPALLALGALDAAGYSVMAPVVPTIAAATGAGPATMGALVAAFPVGIVVAFPIAARAIARGHTTTTVVAASLVILALGTLPFLLPVSLGALFLGRILMGLGSGALWMGVTFGTLERWPGQEYRCMSRVFAAYSIGGLIGPVLGAVEGIRAPFLIYLALVAMAFATIPMLRGTPERAVFRPDRSALRSRGFIAASAGILFAVLVLGLMEGVLPLRFATVLGQTAIAGIFLVAAVVHAGGAGVAARFRPRVAMRISIAVAVAGVGLAAAGTSPIVWVPALAIAGVGVGFGETGSIGILFESVPTDRIVTAMVVWSQIGIAGYLIGPLLGGAVVQAWGFSFLFLVPVAAGLVVLLMLRRARQEGRAS